AALDRESAFLYAEASVEEYWIILGASQKIEVYRNPRNGKFQEVAIFSRGDVIESTGVPGVRIVVADVFGEVD
ncbi:MAG: Uma2 family endonuclease, partial [Limisphaerales bacterium]